MKKLLNILKVLSSAGIALVVFFIFRVSAINAQNVVPLTVAPARQQFRVDPGQTEYFNIKFINQSTSPLYGNLRISDFVVLDNEGNPTLLDDTPQGISSRFSGASWIKLSSEKASIPAGDILTLQLKMQVPKDAGPGGRYIAVSFEPTGVLPAPSGSQEEGALGTSQRIVGLVYVRVNGPISENAFIEKFRTPFFVQLGPIPVSFNILNKGDYHITPKGQVTLTDSFGTRVDSELLDAKNIFPDVSRNYEQNLGSKWLIGRYKIDLTASYGDSGRVLNQTAYVWAFPWALALIIILAIIIIALIIIIIKNRFGKKQKK
ncbi:MAG: hypothetical protein C0410_15640, partial [Anaerolinea sp.]|nr:hypothetical protein [Anaerolinea sp.]